MIEPRATLDLWPQQVPSIGGTQPPNSQQMMTCANLTPTKTTTKSNKLHEANLNNLKSNYMNRSDIKPTNKRYLILILFCFHSAINSLQWIYLSSITSSVAKFYQVDNFAVNLTSTIFMIVYIPLIVPSTWLFERFGMRTAILIGSLGTTLGSAIKCFSCQPGSFWSVLMIGQLVVAISQLFVLSVPPRLASVWFPDDQVSLANACGVFGNQAGIALGFVVPQLVIGNEAESAESIGASLWAMFIGIFAFSALVSLLIVLLFDRTPARPPGLARLQQMIQENVRAQPLVASDGAHLAQSNQYTFGALLLDLAKDINFILLMIGYGLNVGVFYCISTVLNQMISPIWTEANSLVGQLGLLLVISGMLGSVVSGYILDKTRLYRLINVSLYSLTLISLILFCVALEWRNICALYFAIFLLGYFMTGYLFIGYELSNEITWPRPESVTAGLLNMSAQAFGVILTYLGSTIVDNHGNMAISVFLIGWLAFGLVVTLMTKTQLKRQNAIVA